VALSIAAFLIAPAAFCFSQPDHSEAFTGTWKLNPARSSLSAEVAVAGIPNATCTHVVLSGTTMTRTYDASDDASDRQGHTVHGVSVYEQVK
jgi:polyisoprenoid-binding protein YceI